MNLLRFLPRNIQSKCDKPTLIIVSIVLLLSFCAGLDHLIAFVSFVSLGFFLLSSLPFYFFSERHKAKAEIAMISSSLGGVFCLYNFIAGPVFQHLAYSMAGIASLLSLGWGIYCIASFAFGKSSLKKAITCAALAFVLLVFSAAQLSRFEPEDIKKARIEESEQRQQQEQELRDAEAQAQAKEEAAKKTKEIAELAKIVKEGDRRVTIAPAFLYSTLEDLEDGEQSIHARDKLGLIELSEAGKCLPLAEGTQVLVVKRNRKFMQPDKYKIRVLDGYFAGNKGWTPERTLEEPIITKQD